MRLWRRPYYTLTVCAAVVLLLLALHRLEQSNFGIPDPSQEILADTPSHDAAWYAAQYQSIQARIQALIKPWKEPPPGHDSRHWPPYGNYKDTDYDPNAFENFPWDPAFYTESGIQKLLDAGHKPRVYSPYPNYNSRDWKRQWQGEYVPCVGPRGKTLDHMNEDMLEAYPALARDFPKPYIGDATATGIDLSICFDRFSRYRPYGQKPEHAHHHAHASSSQPHTTPNWSETQWQRLQQNCVALNQKRYALGESSGIQPKLNMRASTKALHARTAILIRTWEGYNYTENDLQSIRALIVETSLLSGGEYQVFLFLNVKNNTIDLTEERQQAILSQHIPPELQDITVMWNEKMLQDWYPEVTDWQVYWHQFMPLQWFSKNFPEFDYIWNWEMDVRYIGNHYAFFESMSAFAKKFPRKHAWERSQRFYIPSVHGSYSQFLDDTDRAVRESGRESIWGPRPFSPEQNPTGPVPPTDYANDKFQWGVGEEADLVTLSPIWDPRHTKWDLMNKIWNFIPGIHPDFHRSDDWSDFYFNHPEFPNIHRRVYINTVSRLSARLLDAMHLENSAGRTMQAEMWPATVALHYGLKAVYAPHPIWIDRKWPDWYADAIFNADGGEAGQWSQNPDSVYAHDREHNFAGWSFYFDSSFPKALYRRWLGWKSWQTLSPLAGVGGPSFENEGDEIILNASTVGSDVDRVRVGGYGPMCLPPMLLHPVKNTFEQAEKPPDSD